MLGRLVKEQLDERRIDYTASGRELDVTNPRAIEAGAPSPAPGWVVNCSGYTAVDAAESEADRAWAVNKDGPDSLARYCRRTGARLLHLSTDYVFDGSDPHGYFEDAPTAPINTYGASKEAGERALRSELSEHVILRTAWLYAEHGRNFVLTMLRLLRDRGELTVVNDQHGSPTYARDLAGAILAVTGSPEPVFGTFHFTNAGVTTWHRFACEIRDQALELGLISRRRQIRPISSAQFPTAAERPAYSVLTCRRIVETYAIEPRPWEEALGDCLRRIAAEQGAKSYGTNYR